MTAVTSGSVGATEECETLGEDELRALEAVEQAYADNLKGIGDRCEEDQPQEEQPMGASDESMPTLMPLDSVKSAKKPTPKKAAKRVAATKEKKVSTKRKHTTFCSDSMDKCSSSTKTKSCKPAPKKSKKAVVGADAAQDIIRKYMLKQGKPMNSTKVFENLNKSISHPMVKTALAALAKREVLSVKEEGRTCLYWVMQIAAEEDDGGITAQAELDAANTCVQKLADDVRIAADASSAARAEVALLSKQRTDAEIVAGTAAVRARLLVLANDHERLQASSAKQQISAGCPSLDELRTAARFYESVRKELKRTVMATLAQISEGTGQPVAEIMEEVGVDP